MQHFLAGVEAVSARGVRTSGQGAQGGTARAGFHQLGPVPGHAVLPVGTGAFVARDLRRPGVLRSEEHTSELQSLRHLVCRLLLEKKKKYHSIRIAHAWTRPTGADPLAAVAT